MNGEKIFGCHTHAASQRARLKWQLSGTIPRRTVISDREGNLPVWVRAPKLGMNFIPAVRARSSTNGRQKFHPFRVIANGAHQGRPAFPSRQHPCVYRAMRARPKLCCPRAIRPPARWNRTLTLSRRPVWKPLKSLLTSRT